jgi:ubiquinone/menaquinone biosynthesis C-methylase UbiE
MMHSLGLAPHLHYLSIENMPLQDNTKDVMTSMIASRWWPDAEIVLRLVSPAAAR